MKTTMICLGIAVTLMAAFEIACYMMGFNTHLKQGPLTIAIEIFQAVTLTVALWFFGYSAHKRMERIQKEKWEQHLLELQRIREKQNK